MGQYEQWDIVTGVGITALGVAAGRAMETNRGDGLVTDPFAGGFVEAADVPVPFPTRLQDLDAEPGAELMWTSMSTYLGVRSRFFDRYIDAATASGADQVVLLAAGRSSGRSASGSGSTCRCCGTPVTSGIRGSCSSRVAGRWRWTR